MKKEDSSIQRIIEQPDLLIKIFGYPEDINIHSDLSSEEIRLLIGNSMPPCSPPSQH